MMNRSVLYTALACTLLASSCSNSKKDNGEVASDETSSFMVSSIDVRNTLDTRYDFYTSYTNSLPEKSITASYQLDQNSVVSQTFELNELGQPVALSRTMTVDGTTDTLLTETYTYNDQGLLIEALQSRDEAMIAKAVYSWSAYNKLELESEEHFDRPEQEGPTSRRVVDYQYDEQGLLTNVASSFHYIGSDEIIYREDYGYSSSDSAVEILTYRLPSETPEDRRIEFRDEHGKLVKIENYQSDGGLGSTNVITYEQVTGSGINLTEFPRQCIINVGGDCGV